MRALPALSSHSATAGRICLIAAYGGRGTIQPHVDKLIPSLLRHGYRVRFVGWDRSSTLAKQFAHDGVDYEMILRGGGHASKRLAVWLPLWYLVATVKLLFRPRSPGEVWMAISFEAALPTAIAAMLRRESFIYNCRDNMGMRSSVPGFLRTPITRLDLWLMCRAEAVVVPDENRVPERSSGIRTVIIRNCAPEVTIDRHPDASHFTIYAMGYLRRDRGIDMLLDAVAKVPGCRIIAAGHCPEPRLLARLQADDRVDFRGRLEPTEALATCGEADVVFTFYAPGSEINRRAVSNKWSDAMMASRPILINSEVQKAAWVTEEKIGYSCPYELEALVKTLAYLAEHRSESADRGRRGRELWEAGYRWEEMEKRMIALLASVTETTRGIDEGPRSAVSNPLP